MRVQVAVRADAGLERRKNSASEPRDTSRHRGNTDVPLPSDEGVAMEKRTAVEVRPGQAQWIVERLIADGRISVADVRSLLSGLGQEIAEIERRLSTLRAAAGPTPVAPPAPRSEAPAAKLRKGPRRSKKGHPRGIAGTLAVLLRSIPGAEHAVITSIRATQGIKAAIKAARAAAKNS